MGAAEIHAGEISCCICDHGYAAGLDQLSQCAGQPSSRRVSRRDLPGYGLQISCGPLGAVLHVQRLLKGISCVLCGLGEDLRRLGHPLHLRGISVVHLINNGIAWNTIICFLDIYFLTVLS